MKIIKSFLVFPLYFVLMLMVPMIFFSGLAFLLEAYLSKDANAYLVESVLGAVFAIYFGRSFYFACKTYYKENFEFWGSLDAGRIQNMGDILIWVNYLPIVGPPISHTFGPDKSKRLERFLSNMRLLILFTAGLVFIIGGLLITVMVILRIVDGTLEELLFIEYILISFLGIFPLGLGGVYFWGYLNPKKVAKEARIAARKMPQKAVLVLD